MTFLSEPPPPAEVPARYDAGQASFVIASRPAHVWAHQPGARRPLYALRARPGTEAGRLGPAEVGALLTWGRRPVGQA